MKTTIIKKSAIALSASLISFGGISCSNFNSNTQNHAATGALIGAGAGAIIGNQSGDTEEGALLGAGAGAVGGAIFGNHQDNAR